MYSWKMFIVTQYDMSVEKYIHTLGIQLEKLTYHWLPIEPFPYSLDTYVR